MVHKIGTGKYRVEVDGRSEIVYVAGPPADRWAFWNGQLFRVSLSDQARSRRRPRHSDGTLAVTAPMPATVLKILVVPGATVSKGDTILILEAMKMELPVRASSDAVVKAVLCSEGELVQPDVVLVELE